MNAAYTLHNKYSFGFLEKVYHNSLLIESTVMEIGLLVNFEKSDQVRRKLIGKSVKSVKSASNSNYFKKNRLARSHPFERSFLTLCRFHDKFTGYL